MDALIPKPVVWLRGEVKSPPFSAEARIESGILPRRLQVGDSLGLPHSRPMPSIGPRCHELRVRDQGANWRIVHRIDGDATIIISAFAKATGATPKHVIADCQGRLVRYDEAVRVAAKAAKRKFKRGS